MIRSLFKSSEGTPMHMVFLTDHQSKHFIKQIMTSEIVRWVSNYPLYKKDNIYVSKAFALLKNKKKYG